MKMCQNMTSKSFVFEVLFLANNGPIHKASCYGYSSTVYILSKQRERQQLWDTHWLYIKYQQRRSKFLWGYKVVILILQTVAVLYHCMKPNFKIVFCTFNTGQHKHCTEFHVALASFPDRYRLQSTVITNVRYTLIQQKGNKFPWGYIQGCYYKQLLSYNTLWSQFQDCILYLQYRER